MLLSDLSSDTADDAKQLAEQIVRKVLSPVLFNSRDSRSPDLASYARVTLPNAGPGGVDQSAA